jgi:hypothetical protein
VTSTTAFAANTSGPSIDVSLGGVLVDLPDSQILPPDITVDVANEIFTINTTGRYRISYQVNTTLAIAMGTQILLDGVGQVQSRIAPGLVVSSFSNEFIVDITAGTTVALQLFGIVAAAILLAGGAGATLMIVRLS